MITKNLTKTFLTFLLPITFFAQNQVDLDTAYIEFNENQRNKSIEILRKVKKNLKKIMPLPRV